MEISAREFWIFTVIIGQTIVTPLVVFCFGLLPKTHCWALKNTEDVIIVSGMCLLSSLIWPLLLVAGIIIGPIVFGLYCAAKIGQSSSKKLQEMKEQALKGLKESLNKDE